MSEANTFNFKQLLRDDFIEKHLHAQEFTRPDGITRLGWSPNGATLAALTITGTVILWNAENGEFEQMLEGYRVDNFSWSADGKMLAICGNDHVQILQVGNDYTRSSHQIDVGSVTQVAFSPTKLVLAIGTRGGFVLLWDSKNQLEAIKTNRTLGPIKSLRWSRDGEFLAALTGEMCEIITPHSHKNSDNIESSPGLGTLWNCASWHPTKKTLFFANSDGAIMYFGMDGRQNGVLEGHTSEVVSLSFSASGQFLASKDTENNVRLWRCDTWETTDQFTHTSKIDNNWDNLAFHPAKNVLALVGTQGTALWEINSSLPEAKKQVQRSVHYTNAKIVLVGDSGVGKSALALILSNQPYAKTDSSHGRRIWSVPQGKIQVAEGQEETREMLLWDLAGQPHYRLLHQLHLNEVAIALVVFDARSSTDPFGGVLHWDRALRHAERLPGNSIGVIKKFLVSGRADVGAIPMSPDRIRQKAVDLGFEDYYDTSARENWGIQELSQAIQSSIPWELLPKVSSPRLFRTIKDFLLREKKEGRILSSTEDLYRSFVDSQKGVRVTAELKRQFTICIGRVESSGLIKRLSFGNLVLLQPEVLDTYASALINTAMKEPHGYGQIHEEDVRAGRFRIAEDVRLRDREAERLLLIATVEDMLHYEVALREYSDDGPHLVFPSQLTRENPELPDIEGKSVIFVFKGALPNVYATLVVRLAHSGTFKMKEMWKDAATFTATVGGECSISLHDIGEGEGHGEITLFFDDAASEETKFQFEEYVQAHLLKRALPETLSRRRIFVCPGCGIPIPDKAAQMRRSLSMTTATCSGCDSKVSLLDRRELLTGAQSGERHSAESSQMEKMNRNADAERDLSTKLTAAEGELLSPGFRNWAGASDATLAIVFTDMVGSTALAVELGDEAMSEVRRFHFERVRRFIPREQGFEVKNTGDGFLIAFRTASQALNFVTEIYERTGSSHVNIRAGIHVGAVRIEENDAFGSIVNFAARVMGSAEGSEIRLSDRAAADIKLEKAVAHRGLKWKKHPDCILKGFPDIHTIWSVTA